MPGGVLAAALAVGALSACSDEAGDGDGRPERDAAPQKVCPFEDPTFDPTTPTASFELDVMPVIQAACAAEACHETEVEPPGGLDLGIHITTGIADAPMRSMVRENLLARSTTAPELRRVEPGDPTRSFVMLKLDDCQGALGLTCRDDLLTPCGGSMPFASKLLPAEDRDKFRRWIAQGAPDN